MARPLQVGIVAAGAFAVGVLVATVVVLVLQDEAEAPQGPEVEPVVPAPDANAPEPEAPGARPPRVRLPPAGREIVADDPTIQLAEVAGDLTVEERDFLRALLAAERHRRRESVFDPADGGLDVVRRYRDHGADVSALVNDFAAMRERIRTVAGPLHRVAATGARTTVDLTGPLAEAAVIEFGPGTFVLERGGGWNVRRDEVESLEIRGAGMDETTLIGPGWAFLCCEEKGAVRNVLLRDLTIDGTEQGQIILDARGDMAVALERVRMKGWEVAGHAAAIGVSGNAFLAARECEFLGPGDGFVVSLRGMALVTLEDCLLSDARAAFIGAGGKDRPAVLHASGCVFDNVPLADRALTGGDGERKGVAVSVRGGSVTVGSSAWTDEQRREHWGAEHAVSVEGVTFGPGAPLFSARDAERVLRLAPAAGARNILAIDVHPRGRREPTDVDIYSPGGEGDRAVRKTYVYDGATLVPAEKEPRRGMRGYRTISAADLASSRSLLDLVAAAALGADEAFESMELRANMPTARDGEIVQSVWLMIHLGGQRRFMIDAQTGEVVKRP